MILSPRHKLVSCHGHSRMEDVCIFAYQNPGAEKFEVRASSTTPLSCRARAGTDIDGFFFPGGGGLCVFWLKNAVQLMTGNRIRSRQMRLVRATLS